MKRILFLVSSMQGGGAERVAALLCNHWVDQGQEVTLMPTYSQRGECLYSLDRRVRVDFLADRVDRGNRSMLNTVRRFVALRRGIQEIDPDIVVSFLPHVNVAAVLSAWGLRIPVVVSERVFPPAVSDGGPWKTLRRWTYPRALAVVMQTERGREWLRREIPRARGEVAPNPCVYPTPDSAPRVDPANHVAPESCLLVAVGRLEKQKGFDELIDAFAALTQRFPDWQLAILGEGGERTMLEQRRDSLGLQGRVLLPGRVGNMMDWYRSADIYVMSSHFEGFPNTLLEAMAHGLPAVSTNCDTGPAEIIRDGVDGRLVSPGAGVAGLSDALADLMTDRDERRRMGREATAVRDRFAMERVGAVWDAILGLDN